MRGVQYPNRAGLKCSINGKDAHDAVILALFTLVAGLMAVIHVFVAGLKTHTPGASPGMPQRLSMVGQLHRPYFDHVGHEVAQQVLDAVLEGSG